MTQLLEPVAIGLWAVAESKGPCWYCEEPAKEDLENEETADPDTSDSDSDEDPPENDVVNCSSALGTNLGKEPNWEIRSPDDLSVSSPIVPAAHHCIPGGASLAKATALHDFMRKGGPFKLASDIGYNVNAAANGVWLPGNYAVRPGQYGWSKKWGNCTTKFKTEYASRAMKKANRQFHDAHVSYNNKVLKTLEAMAEELAEPEDECPVCGKELDCTRPPFGLVGRLNAVSSKHRAMLIGLSKRTKKCVQNGYYTSSRMKTYFNLA
ncbi:MAG: AHH domain-containing protein [Rubrivivax sp.]|nr:AHH domain-containing protein [Rubrivivax sp.]